MTDTSTTTASLRGVVRARVGDRRWCAQTARAAGIASITLFWFAQGADLRPDTLAALRRILAARPADDRRRAEGPP